MRKATQLAKTTIDEVFRRYQDVKIGFVEPVYWQTLRTTYERTLEDIVGLAKSQFTRSQIRILEVGAFCGVVVTALRAVDDRFDVTAWDLPLFQNDEALAGHYRHMGIHSASGNLAQLPFEFSTGAFDIIICCEVVEHLNFNPLPLFCEFNRLLKEDGILYVGTPNQANIVKRLLLVQGKSIHSPIQHLVWQLDPTATFSVGLHWREYTAKELRQILDLTGFKVLQSYYCHTNECRNPNVLRRLLVHWMYACFPSFLPSQVVVGIKKASCDVNTLKAKRDGISS
jgi:2-polyprenyl-3-methyl-5-hydroxy-6-metoxy-1,4-benzoquinol methylase